MKRRGKNSLEFLTRCASILLKISSISIITISLLKFFQPSKNDYSLDKKLRFFSFNSNRLLYRLYRRINNRRNILTLEVKLNISVDWEICISSTRPTERRFLFFSIVPRSGRDRGVLAIFFPPPFFSFQIFQREKENSSNFLHDACNNR